MGRTGATQGDDTLDLPEPVSRQSGSMRLGTTVSALRLEGFDQARVCVVGGGISGAIVALKLARAGIEVVVLERLPLEDSLETPRGAEASEVETDGRMR